MRVACLGECMIEIRERPDGLLSRGFGGDTLNTALYLARLGVTVSYATALGDDPHSAEMIAAWEGEGIGTGLVARAAGAVPGLYLIQTDAKGERRFSYWRDSAPVRRLFELPEADRIADGLRSADVVYLSGITLSLFRGAGMDRLFDVLGAARGRIVFDTNFRPRGWPDRDEARAAYDRALRLADTVLAGVEDFALLEGEATPEGVIARLRDVCVEEIVVKLEAPGCVVATGARETPVPPPETVVPVDTTAAGDSFAAAYLAARLAGAAPEAAALAGHRLAGVVVRHPGAIIPRDAMPARVLDDPPVPR